MVTKIDFEQIVEKWPDFEWIILNKSDTKSHRSELILTISYKC